MTLTERLSALYTGAVYDVLRSMGHRNVALPAELRPIDPTQTVAGPVFTVSGEPTTDIDEHGSLLLWTEFLSAATEGSVVICQPNDSSLAHMGELSGETLQKRKVAGYVVDGGCRDVSSLLQRGFPVWCRYYTPADIVARWAVRSTGESIRVGDVTVHAGDYALADRDGVVIVPQAIIGEVIADAEAVVDTENEVRRAILNGVDPKDAYLRYGKF